MNYFFRKRKRQEEEEKEEVVEEEEDPLVKRLRRDPDTVWDSIEEDQDDTNMSTFKHMETKIEDFKQELNDSLGKLIKEFEEEYEEIYGEVTSFDWPFIMNDNNKKTRLYHKLRHLFIAYIHKLRKWLKNKFVLNTILTYYQKIQLYYAIISDNSFLTCTLTFVEYLGNDGNDNNVMITLFENYFEMLKDEITSKLNFTLTSATLAKDIFDSNADLI